MIKRSFISAALLFLGLCFQASAQAQRNRLGDYNYHYAEEDGVTGKLKPFTYRLQLQPKGICRMTDSKGKWRYGWYRINARRICVTNWEKMNFVGCFTGANIIFPPDAFWGNVNSSGPYVRFIRPAPGYFITEQRDMPGYTSIDAWVELNTTRSQLKMLAEAIKRQVKPKQALVIWFYNGDKSLATYDSRKRNSWSYGERQSSGL